jgi:hypothetical protein
VKYALVAFAFAACAIDAPAMAPEHPANSAAPIGRLAPPPAAFGSAAPSAPPPMQPMPMHHHS